MKKSRNYKNEGKEVVEINEPEVLYTVLGRSVEASFPLPQEMETEVLRNLLRNSVKEALNMERDGSRCSTCAAMDKLDREMQWK